jgi:hypothetical protein
MRIVMCVVLAATVVACAPKIERVRGSADSGQMAELWVEPGSRPRNLYDGPPGIDDARPESDARYEVISKDTRGFSITYKVRDSRQREWNVKLGPEAQTEVTSSRIVWAAGYHAVPSYFVERWIAVEHAKGAMLGGARFRPHDLGLKSLGTWSWQQNPFVGTRQYNALLALMMILNSTDLKNDNNALYEVQGGRREEARHWYVVKDLGASLGETGRMDPRRGDIDSFERGPFVRRVDDGRVLFDFRGRHQELLKDRIGVDDVRWICERLQRIGDRQLRHAFRAGHFSEETTTRYVARLRQKIDQGLSLQ